MMSRRVLGGLGEVLGRSETPLKSKDEGGGREKKSVCFGLQNGARIIYFFARICFLFMCVRDILWDRFFFDFSSMLDVILVTFGIQKRHRERKHGYANSSVSLHRGVQSSRSDFPFLV